MSEPMMWLLVRGVWETLAMTFVSGFFGFVIGLPVGVLLYVTRPGQIIANAKLYRTISAIVNIFRSIPFIILLVWMIPFTRVIVGTSIGLQAAIVPLTVGAAPFIARMVENALLEIPTGLIEASRAMGATPMQIVRKVLLPEALPGLVNAATITLITLVGYSAMGGAVGAGVVELDGDAGVGLLEVSEDFLHRVAGIPAPEHEFGLVGVTLVDAVVVAAAAGGETDERGHGCRCRDDLLGVAHVISS